MKNLRAGLKIQRGPVFAERAVWQGATSEHNLPGLVSEKSRHQTALSAKTLRAAGLLAGLALLNAGMAKAGNDGGTNTVSGQVRNLLDAAGYSFAQETVSLPRQYTHSLRNLGAIDWGWFGPLTVPVKKNGWSLWNNSSFKTANSSPEQTSVRAQYEYDVTYSFIF